MLFGHIWTISVSIWDFRSAESKLFLLFSDGLVNCDSTYLHLPLSDIFNRQLAQLAGQAVAYNALNLPNWQISSLICQQTTMTRADNGRNTEDQRLKTDGCIAPCPVQLASGILVCLRVLVRGIGLIHVAKVGWWVMGCAVGWLGGWQLAKLRKTFCKLNLCFEFYTPHTNVIEISKYQLNIRQRAAEVYGRQWNYLFAQLIRHWYSCSCSCSCCCGSSGSLGL